MASFQPILANTTILKESTPEIVNFDNNTGKSLEDELKEIQAKRKEIEKQKNEIQARKNSLLNEIGKNEDSVEALGQQIAELNNQIKDKELLIQELAVQIEIMIKEINRLNSEIALTKNAIQQLEVETDQRMVNMYLNQKQNSHASSIIFSADGPSSLVKIDTYQQALQEETNQKLQDLDEARIKLEKDKEEMENKKVEIDRSKTLLSEEKIALDTKKTLIDKQKQSFFFKITSAQNTIVKDKELDLVLSEADKELRVKQDAIQNAMLKRSEITSGLPVKAGTMLGIEGNTGYSYGSHLHFGVSSNGAIQNPCNYLPAGAYGSCGGNGTLRIPLSGAVLTSGFKSPSRPSHSAIDVATGGGGSVVAAHDGYVYFFFEPCPAWANVCNGGGAIVAKVCEVDKCTSGLSTVYYHLRCTSEPASSPRSCK
ncbi:hypothetical protein KBD45_01965 [Candidatus Dojkabacteria bacterium]|nr:hypothetical protein [Candidatus Dojkabacteria bacterium]